MKFPGFINGADASQSIIADGEWTANFYLEKAKGALALYPTPGFQSLVTASDVGTRGALEVGNQAWVVIGPGLYSVSSVFGLTRLATVSQDNNPATLSYNSGQLFITSGGNGYIWASGVLTQVLTNAATLGGMLNGRFIAFDATLSKVRISNVNDGLTWDPTQFALRTAQPDPWVAMVIAPPDIWLLGELTGDVWFDSGAFPFPLAPRSGLTVPYGVVSPFAVSLSGGSLFFLARNKDGDGIVVQSRGYGVNKISTPAIDTAIAGYKRASTITDAESIIFQIEGHTWFVLRFPSAQKTLCFDITTGQWIQLGKWDSGRGDYGVWAPRVHMSAFGRHVVGDSSSGTLSAMDVTYGSEADGSAIRRLRRGPVLVDENRKIRIQRFEVLFEAGVGTQTGQGANPQMMYRGSRDGGKTWGSERQMAIGRAGEYFRRAFVTRVGAPRLYVPELTVSDPVPLRIVDAYLNNSAAA